MQFQQLHNRKDITEPKFTEEGLYLPADFYHCYISYHNAIITELERLHFPEFILHSLDEGVSPSIGFAEWVREASIVMWVLSLKKGRTHKEFYPASIAKQLFNISRDMLLDALLDRLVSEDFDSNNVIKH
jgi:hypothetical protein